MTEKTWRCLSVRSNRKLELTFEFVFGAAELMRVWLCTRPSQTSNNQKKKLLSEKVMFLIG